MTTTLMLKTQNPASMTVIRSARKAFCGKAFIAADTPEGFTEERPQPGLLWKPGAVEVRDLDSMLRALRMVAGMEDAAVIRGALSREITDEEFRTGVYRRLVDGGFDNGVWVPQARTWAAFDLDGATLAESPNMWAHLSDVLPAPLKGVSFVWNLTSSHLLKPGVRCRLFFLLSDPVQDGSLRQWSIIAPDWMHLDASLFSANHIHYVTAPQFTGLQDPVGERWGIHRTSVEVADASAFNAFRPRDLDPRSLGFVVNGLVEMNPEEVARRVERIRKQVTTGARHDHMAGVACELVSIGMPPELIEPELDDLFRQAGREPTAGESWRLIKHACGKLREGRLTVTQQPVAKVLDDADAAEATPTPPEEQTDGEEIVAEAPAQSALYGSNDMMNAATYRRVFYPDGGFIRWGEQDWEWTGKFWRRLENDEVLVQRIQKQTDMKHSRAVSTSRSFRSLMSVERLQQPCHLDGSPLGRLLVFDNGVLDLDQWLLDPRAPLLPHDSRRFVTNALPYAHDPTAECPRLLSFMESMWPTQLDQRREYQKMLGYLMMAENPLQKMFILLGSPRSGKGTSLRLIRSLVGSDSCCAPNLSSLANDFGLDAMLGKSVALVGEMNQQSKLPDVAIDRLKSISGGDVVPVNRKNKGELYLEMPVRFVINCNRLPGFLDPSGALASRIVLFTMWESYLGREDANLDSALRAELPGIAQFALEGLRLLLVEDGAFVAPQSAKNAAAAQRAIQAPTMTFLEACVAPAGPEDWISSKELYGAYCAWAQEQGHHPVSAAKLHIELAMRWPAVNDVAKTRRTADGGVRERWRSNFTFTEEGRSYVTSAKLPNEA